MVDCKGDSRLVRRFADRVIERMRMTRGRGVNRGAVGTRMRLNSKRTGQDEHEKRRCQWRNTSVMYSNAQSIVGIVNKIACTW